MVDTNRAQGLMVGLAVGNLLGLPMEGWTRQRIAELYPGGVREITVHPGAPDDDDLAQAIEIAKAAVPGHRFHDFELGQRFWVWGEENGAGMGDLTGDVLALYGGDHPQRLAQAYTRVAGKAGKAREPNGIPIIEASKQAWGGNRAGNGALMRCAPLAIRWHDDPHRLVQKSIISAVPTHWDQRCGWSCVLANLAAAAALRGEMLSPEDLMQSATDGMKESLQFLHHYDYHAEPPEAVSEAVTQASQSTLDDLRLDGDNMGFTLLSLKAALISYWRAEDFESGLRQVVEAGGDTDTNGAIVGAMLGARFGLTAIPERWRRRVARRTGRVPIESHVDWLIASNLGEVIC